MLEAYCARRSHVAGDQVTLHLSADAPRVQVTVLRDGRVPQPVLSKDDLPASRHAVPDDVVANGCGWPVAWRFPVPESWASGLYRIELSAGDERAEAFFVVRAARPRASILWVLETNTWNAYNFYGGQSTYTSGDKAYASGAPRVSFQRPLPPGFLSLPADAPRIGDLGPRDKILPYARWALAHGYSPWTGAASWGQWGRRFQDWLEAEQVTVDYATNADLEEFPVLLDGYRLMLSVGHDEYWSWGMRDTVEAFIARGGNVAFLSGNCSYWQVRLERDYTQMVAFKGAVDDDPVLGTARERHNTGIWSHRLTARPENQMTGLSFTRGGYARMAGATPGAAGGYTVYRPEHWALAGTGLSYGDQLGAAHTLVGYETDGCEFQIEYGRPVPTGADGTPRNFEIIGIAPATLFSHDSAPRGLYPPGAMTDVEVVAEQVLGRHDAEAVQRFVHGHAVMGSYVSPGGGTVFSAGTTEWAYCLADPKVACITRNLLARLG
ncbi:MAG: hypothetical protein K2Y51_25245 [Gammaproteobacteria bacterium]|nr:hypothetical protein [Gammaproteobacteria bacterium]